MEDYAFGDVSRDPKKETLVLLVLAVLGR